MSVSLAELAGSCKQSGRVLPPLSESFRKSDKQPFGGYIAYKEFRNLFKDRYVETVTEPFDQEWNVIKDYSNNKKYSLYFLITKNLVLNYSEVNAFMDYVKAGNDLFISADYIDTRLLENINCNNERMAEIVDETKGLMRQTKVSMFFDNNFKAPAYGYYYYPFLNSLSSFDTAFVRVLGVNENNDPNYIILFSGKGRIYLHVAPRVFSNYFLLSGDNYQYIENVISFLRSDPKNIYWDEYYKNASPNRRKSNNGKDDNNFSSLSVIRQHPPLLWAFWLAIIGLLLFILFNVKRKQRIIDVIKPNVNTTVNFTETVGRLYLQKKNNNHIAEKMITYFYEHIRNKYFINTSTINDEFINSLAGKSGVPIETMKRLFALIRRIHSGENIDDATLIQLNNEIENFYKNQS
ncbi:DUF4350 domain-containing protein [Ginsengibacter hankyongi]|uniref:DUF4350 domain-containing protein n=1 Tax=Ginsengibacter hankyongi TaxID=2607284 RepID=A0A5J5IJX1_9BACT|nr:DUF4350 domain-containing protein [Ginsengibacter hankyongi]KAA9041296.1 DUF4350 domain-containing protein [Ginsengibacter hankyongi]